MGFVVAMLFLTAFLAAVESQGRYYYSPPYYYAASLPDECRSCNPENCPAPVDCLAGIVRDVCGCCDVCGKEEFELCDHPAVLYARRPTPASRSHHGRCGDNLECRVRTDLDRNREPEAICYCRTEDVICGSDGVTYDNPCQFKASATLAKDIRKITVARKGPCSSVPVILSPPDNTRNVPGSNIALMCEAKGFPVPNIEWTWTRVDGQIVYLPSDDLHISVNTRGGPERWQITGWLQILDLKRQHEGDYTCIAQNDRGITQASARINVFDAQGKDRNM